MKVSEYNIIVKEAEDGSVLLFNSISGAFVELTKEYRDILDKVVNKQSSDELQNLYSKEINNMKCAGIIIDSNINERKILNVKKYSAKYSKDNYAITIAPTTNCNMKCPYCYENKSNKRMSDQTIDDLIAFVKDQYLKTGFKTLSVCWYGGEPLLEMNTIKILSKEFIKLCEENDIKYYGSMITNGTLLSVENAKILKDECQVNSCQITLDGYSGVHDYWRPMKDGQSGFKIITENIDSIKDFFSISIRVNVSKENISNIKELLDYVILKKNWLDSNYKITLYLAPVTNCQEACNINDSQILTMEEFGCYYDEFLDYLKNRNMNMSVLGRYPTPHITSCASECVSSYVIGPEGEFYKCFQELGQEDCRRQVVFYSFRQIFFYT